ncbi:MAG: ribonuclease PH [Bacillota bacterium]
MTRIDKRKADELRPFTITPGFIPSADGSVLMECGHTRIICTATAEDKVPPFRIESGLGWIHAEYGMLPGSTIKRKARPILKQDGRSMEIQRLIGRSLRSVANMAALGERTITVDCDVIEADGGTRTASVTGGFVALVLAVGRLIEEGKIGKSPILDYVAAVSAGLVNGEALLDLCYAEDSGAQADLNLVMTGTGGVVEVQGTAEDGPFSRAQLDALLMLGEQGIQRLVQAQKQALGQNCCLVGGKA